MPSFRKEVDSMDYVILLKTLVDADCKRNVIEKIPCEGEVTLAFAYKLCECQTIDIKESLFEVNEPLEAVFIKRPTFIFDDEFLLKHSNPIANEVASLAFGYGTLHNQCLCGNVMMCKTDEEGETFPFTEKEADCVVKILERLNKCTPDISFKVQAPTVTFMEF